MIDTIKTLKNLNKKFPRFQLNTLFEILDCIEEKEENTITTTWYPPIITTPTVTPSTITCTDTDISSKCKSEYTSASTCDNQILFEPKKHHIKDKTSKNVKILTEEAPVEDDEADTEVLYKETINLLQDYLTKLEY